MWTKERPEQPGYYFVRYIGQDETKLVFWIPDFGVMNFGNHNVLEYDHVEYWWSVPVLAPEFTLGKVIQE